jgi:hypothetical protein
MAKYNLTVDLEEGVDANGEARSSDKIENYLRLAVQQALTKANCLINKVEVKKSAARQAGAPRAKGTAGRKPINRPRIEAWIRENITAGPSTQGTTGLNGVDKNGRPLKDAPNRIYPHRLLQPMPEGVGLSMPAILKVLGELEVEGYVERGFAAGAPFYELIRPLEEEGKVGIRGRDDDDEVDDEEPDAQDEIALIPARSVIIDWSQVGDEELPDID